MKFGLSTYSLHRAIQANEMTVLDVIDWTADQGGEHVEIVPIGYSLTEDPSLIEKILQKAQETGLEISNYAVGANFSDRGEEEFRQEVTRLQREVDIAHRLGVKRMRHDVSWRPIGDTSIVRFEQELPQLVTACQEVADYAAQYGIVTSVENHGYYVQAADRVQRLVAAANRPNFKTTLDVGNFMCVDENPLVSVQKNLPLASMVHIKDFYLRSGRNPGEGWFPTSGGAYLRGAIIGNGDIDLWPIMKAIKESDYDGYVSIEFEGLEECKFGSRVGLENVRRIWAEC